MKPNESFLGFYNEDSPLDLTVWSLGEHELKNVLLKPQNCHLRPTPIRVKRELIFKSSGENTLRHRELYFSCLTTSQTSLDPPPTITIF